MTNVILEQSYFSTPETMTTKRLLPLALAGALSLLASCGGHDGVELGPFAALNKTEGDEPFKLTAPTSKSPAPFSYTSSDLSVASIQGDTVTIHRAGNSTITAQQGKMGSYYPTSTSALLTVARRACTEPAERDASGVCVAPATAATAASYVTSAGLSWMPTSFGKAWAGANTFCRNTKINDANGWRLPTQLELATLVASGDLADKKWAMLDTWTSGAGNAEKQHFAVNLSTNATTSRADDNTAYVTCVK